MTGGRKASVRNVVETPWRQYPGHHGGALSKPLVDPETQGARHIDYRISMYQPMAHVERHVHAVQEQVYHVLEGEATIELDGEVRIARRHDVVYVPPGVVHSVSNNGLCDLVFIVVTSPVSDEQQLKPNR